MRALIIAGGRIHRGSLAASRALARTGWLVGCGSSDRATLVASSRATKHWHFVPPPEQDLDSFINAVQAAVERIGYEVVLPSSDAETLALSFGRDRIDACVPYPSHENVLRAFDKLELAAAAQRAGLATPRTVLATDEELSRVDGPVVVKSRLHWNPGSKTSQARWETFISSNRSEASQRAKEIQAGGGAPLLQEVVVGRIVHCHVIMTKEGELVTCVQQLSEPLTWPSHAGTRVRSKTVPLDERLAKGVSTFLRDLGWFGFASLQFMQPEDDAPRLIDFNGRLPLSFQQSIAAGPNFPALWACVATDREYGDVGLPRIGVRFQWLEGDIHRAFVERRGGLVRDLMDCLRYARGSVHGVWKRDDPRPALNYWGHYLRRWAEETFAARHSKQVARRS